MALVDEDGSVMLGDQRLVPGTEVQVRGRRGKFRYKEATVTSQGRVVVCTIGPIGVHQAFRNFYLEDIRPVKKSSGSRRVA